MKNLLLFLTTLFLIELNSSVSLAQLQLVNRFEEMNNIGTTHFGSAVQYAGDVNGDGYSDIIVGAYKYGDYENIGKAYLYFGGAQMDSIPDLTFIGEQVDNYFGCSVSTAGDVNGDGYDDIIIGAYGANFDDGKAYLYFGGAEMDTVADLIFIGKDSYPEYENGKFAISVASAGDFNGDGYDDIIIGSSEYENDDIHDGDYTGGVHLYFGGVNMDNTRDMLFVGKNDGDQFGYSVASAGDFNNDGYSDIIVGAYGADEAYIYLGGANPDTTYDLVLTDNDPSEYAEFGSTVSSAGDVNGDNYDDVIIGNSNTTSAYIYYGGSTLDPTADVNLIYTGGDFGGSVSTAGDVNNDGYDDVLVSDNFYYDDTKAGHAYIFLGGSTMDNVMDYSFSEGETQWSSFGLPVAYAGDINNDGFSDIIVSDANESNSVGSVYLYLGSQSMDNYVDVHFVGEGSGNTFGQYMTSGDFNGDGYPDIAVEATMYNNGEGITYFYFGGINADTVADLTIPGRGEISSAGDVNGDGYDDFLIANTSADNYKGEVYLYYGGNPMDTQHDFVFKGKYNYQYFGTSLSSAGDVNGDGYDDIIIGSNSKYADIFFGGETLSLTSDVHLEETSLQNFGKHVSSAGDVNNDGYDDVMVSGDHYSSSNLGRVLIYFGGQSMDATADVGLSGEHGYDGFGRALSSAGDVNGDGYDDVIIGAYKYNSDGRAYIFYGGSPMSTTAGVTLDAETPGDEFGYIVSKIGDINSDGYDDVIVGAPYFYIDSYHTTMGKSYIYYGGSSMSTTPQYTIVLDYTKYYISSSSPVACGVGDFNGDGKNNFVVSNFDHIQNGMAFLYYDSNSALPVELTSFSANAQQDGVLLSWKTATEVNNYGFEIERSVAQIVKQSNEWEKIGFVEGHGNSNSPKQYKFLDNSVTGGKYIYRLKQIDTDGSYKYSKLIEVNTELPGRFELLQNYPNPFNPTTTIKYSIPTSSPLAKGRTEEGFVTLKVYDVLGREIKTLVNKKQSPGNYTVEFNAANLPSGLYFYKLTAGSFSQTKKMILMK